VKKMRERERTGARAALARKGRLREKKKSSRLCENANDEKKKKKKKTKEKKPFLLHAPSHSIPPHWGRG